VGKSITAVCCNLSQYTVCQLFRKSVNVCKNYREIKKVNFLLEHGVLNALRKLAFLPAVRFATGNTLYSPVIFGISGGIRAS